TCSVTVDLLVFNSLRAIFPHACGSMLTASRSLGDRIVSLVRGTGDSGLQARAPFVCLASDCTTGGGTIQLRSAMRRSTLRPPGSAPCRRCVSAKVQLAFSTTAGAEAGACHRDLFRRDQVGLGGARRGGFVSQHLRQLSRLGHLRGTDPGY